MELNIDQRIQVIAEKAMNDVKDAFSQIERVKEHNQQKVLSAFIECGVSSSHFTASNGYGYDDRGREALDEVFARVFDCEDALVRHNFVSGTHALTVALFGILRPGDSMLSVTGIPYDTMQKVIGIGKDCSGSLKDFGVQYKQTDFTDDGKLDYEGIESNLATDVKVVYIQRSRGYALRAGLSCLDISKIVRLVKGINPNCVVLVDNCYGEFVEEMEPTSVCADLIVGSLIKNPGGGIAQTGGYIAGKAELIEKCACRLTTPGTGKEIGATLGHNRELFMGLFNAPHVVGEAIKTAVFTAAFFSKMGFDVMPGIDDKRTDIVQVVQFHSEKLLEAFCQGVQKGSPVDSFVRPESWDMPGYGDKVIMAAGTFTLGASIELSADAPIREPYAVYVQGGLNFYSGKMGVMVAADEMLNRGLIKV